MVGANYYSFLREIKEILNVESNFILYYKTPSGWNEENDAKIFYAMYDNYNTGGSQIGGWNESIMEDSLFSGWKKIEMDKQDDVKSIYAGFPQSPWPDQYKYNVVEGEVVFCKGRGSSPVETCEPATSYFTY